jgi:hypothetical protein
MATEAMLNSSTPSTTMGRQPLGPLIRRRSAFHVMRCRYRTQLMIRHQTTARSRSRMCLATACLK